MTPSHLRRLAITSQLLMAGYFVVDNHVDLAPWNNLDAAGPQLASTLSGVIPAVATAIAFAIGARWLMLAGTIWTWIFLALQIRQWWVPYLFGSTFLHRSWEWYTDHGYDETLSFLPANADHPVPDAQHLVLEALTLTMAVLSTVALRRTRQTSLQARTVDAYPADMAVDSR